MPSRLSERERGACNDIIENGLAARSFIAGMSFDVFATDRRTHYAVVR
jgi:hypothetical protein